MKRQISTDMVILVFTLLIAFSTFTIAFPQGGQPDKPKIPIERFQVSVLANVMSFYLNGQYKIFESPMAFGVAYTGRLYPVETGLYVSPVVLKDADSKDVKLGLIWHTRLFQAIGGGIGYNFWDDGVGLVPPEKSTVFIVVSVNVGG